jgi:tRNA threonylcarbamoyladenosine biosynthesis protein TsaB
VNLLALDTAGPVLSAALSTDAGSWYAEIDAGSRHSELLMECVDALCKSAGLSPRDLSLAACMKGPGSFTGLRIGFAAAKGLALALGIPLRTASTLDCLAYPLSPWPGLVIPALDAKKGCFFTALYRQGERLCEDLDASPQAVAAMIAKTRLFPEEKIIATGAGAEILAALLAEQSPPEHVMVDPLGQRGRARELLEIVKKSNLEGLEGMDEINSGPAYIRKSDAELNLKQK